MEQRHKVLQTIGLATRARRLVSGEDTCQRQLRAGKGQLCIVAEDASDNTKKRFSNMCNYHKVEIVFFGQKEELGKFTGKEIRTVIVITDDGFAKKIKELLAELTGVHEIGKNKST